MRWDWSVKSRCHAIRGANFTLGWETLGFARRLGAGKSRYSNRFVGSGRSAETMWTGGERIIECPGLASMPATRCLRVSE